MRAAGYSTDDYSSDGSVITAVVPSNIMIHPIPKMRAILITLFIVNFNLVSTVDRLYISFRNF